MRRSRAKKAMEFICAENVTDFQSQTIFFKVNWFVVTINHNTYLNK